MRDHEGQAYVIEVNGIPAWKGLQSVTDVNIAQCLVDDLIERRIGNTLRDRSMKFDPSALQAAVRRACELDVNALKPGNVSMDSPGYGMTAADFFASAEPLPSPSRCPD